MDATEVVLKWISMSLEDVLEALSDKPIGYVVLLVDGEHAAVRRIWDWSSAPR